MKHYADDGHETGVQAYEAGADYIRVRFTNGAQYLYDERSAGAEHVREMKKRAAKGAGLSTYISQHVRDRYAAREK